MKTPANDRTTRIPQSAAAMLSLNLNSILSVIVLGVVGWVGMKTATNADALIELRTSQPYLTQTIGDLKQQLATLVSRAELDSRIASMHAEQSALEVRLHTIEIEYKTNLTREPNVQVNGANNKPIR